MKSFIPFLIGAAAIVGAACTCERLWADDNTKPEKEPQESVKQTTNSIGMKLVLIPAGKFVMGSPKDEKDRDEDEAQHEVEITKPFYLGTYTVTLGQFRAFVKDAGYQTAAEKDGQGGWGYNAETKKFEGRQPHYNWKNPVSSRRTTTRWQT